jgi:hypothetical protein
MNKRVNPRFSRFLIKEKRGDVAINILVVLVLIMAITTLFVFSSHGGDMKARVLNSKVAGGFYVYVEEAKDYLSSSGERALLETYEEFVKGVGANDYIKNRQTNGEGIPNFVGLADNLDEKFKNRFSEKFKEDFGKFVFERENLIGLQKVVSEDKFLVEVSGGDVILKINQWEFIERAKEEDKDKIVILHTPKIIINFDLEKIGLHTFKDLDEVKENCKVKITVGEKKKCFEEGLFNFEIKLEGEVVKLISKKKFLIKKVIEKFDFSFIPK